MPKGPQGQKQPPKSKKLPRKLPENPVSQAVPIIREATNQEVGDEADKVTRTPKSEAP